MKYSEFFDAVCEDFGKDVALVATIMLSINVSKYPTMEELSTQNLYTNNLKESFKNILWETDKEIFELALKCWENANDWEIGQTMNGLGGCVKKSFKELVEK